MLCGLNTFLPDTKALMCFCCAQIHCNSPLWSKMYEPRYWGQHTDVAENTWTEHTCARHNLNMIEYYSVRDSLRSFFTRREEAFRLRFDLDWFKSDMRPMTNMMVTLFAIRNCCQTLSGYGALSFKISNRACLSYAALKIYLGLGVASVAATVFVWNVAFRCVKTVHSVLFLVDKLVFHWR